MKERPILFSAPMVRAILAETKTQTRRVVKDCWGVHGGIPWTAVSVGLATTGSADIRCPYGQPGDRLWVRENGWERPYRTPKQMREGADTWPPYEYDVEPVCCWEDGELKRLEWKRRPSIHMPRWASRITLEVTGVRVERLQDISEGDAIAEGIESLTYRDITTYRDYSLNDEWAEVSPMLESPIASYRSLWEQINGPGSWDANPWVWVVEFKLVTP